MLIVTEKRNRVLSMENGETISALPTGEVVLTTPRDCQGIGSYETYEGAKAALTLLVKEFSRAERGVVYAPTKDEVERYFSQANGDKPLAP